MKQFEHIELREKVLKRIRNALINKTELNAEQMNVEVAAFKPFQQALPFEFAKNFTEAGGFFYYSENRQELKIAINTLLKEKEYMSVYCSNDDLSGLINTGVTAVMTELDDLPATPVVITECEFLCARTGTILLSSFLSCGRRGIATNDALIVVARLDQILPDISDAIQAVTEKYSDEFPSQLTFVTGPSRTADIEKQIVMGAHGSKEVYVFLH
ncbi:Lactate utilization protein C [bioreactor metagenome]|uniref:Lactate utilization protein C n=1 Tax=bioreactor metagenome TaxID=1076179 RepID=A0A644X0Q2_9ZZZZ